MVGGRHRIAALVLGEVHRSIRHLDQFLRRRTVQRIAGNTEARTDIFLAQQRIGRYPTAQFGGQLPRVFHIRFWHQDDELIAAVSRDYVGAPTIGL